MTRHLCFMGSTLCSDRWPAPTPVPAAKIRTFFPDEAQLTYECSSFLYRRSRLSRCAPRWRIASATTSCATLITLALASRLTSSPTLQMCRIGGEAERAETGSAKDADEDAHGDPELRAMLERRTSPKRRVRSSTTTSSPGRPTTCAR